MSFNDQNAKEYETIDLLWTDKKEKEPEDATSDKELEKFENNSQDWVKQSFTLRNKSSVETLNPSPSKRSKFNQPDEESHKNKFETLSKSEA